MFFKSDQTNVADARDAVKKQLLRSLIQQVVDELNGESDQGFDSEISEYLADDALQPVLQGLRSSMEAAVKEQLFSGLVSDVVSELAPGRDEIQAMVEASLAEKDLDAVREIVREQIDQRMSTDIIPNVVAEESERFNTTDLSVHSGRIKDAVTSIQADDVIGRLRSMVSDALNERLQSEMDEQVDGAAATLARVKDEFVSERIEQFLFSADWKVALEEAEADIAARVVSAIEETMANDETFSKRIGEELESRVTKNDELKERLEADATDRIVAVLSGHLIADLHENETLKADLVATVTSNEEAMAALIERVSERVNEHLASESVARLHQTERVADAAFLHVDTEHRHLTEAVDSLEKQLVKDISGRAIARLADPQTVQSKAMAWIPEDHSIVTAAVEQILQHVSSEVRKRATKEASDTDTIVGNVLPSFTAETEEVRAAVRETRNKLVERVVNLTLHEMEDAKQVAAEANKRVANEHERVLEAIASTMGLLTDRVADQAIERLSASEEVAPEAASRVPVDNEVFQRAIKATMSLLIDDIVIEVGSRMRSSEKVSSDARKRMADTPAEVRQASGVLENMLLQQVAEMTKERLYDVQHASEKASTFLRATKEIDAIEEAMRIKLFKGMADQVVASMEDPERAGAEAFWHIDQQHDHILDAMAELRNQLLFNIAKETMTAIADSETTAAESRSLIPATSRQLTDAATKLHDTLVAEVAREAMNLMRDTERVVEQAGAKLEDHQEAIDGMRRIVEKHLMENLLASALTDIGTSVSGMDEPAERVFFRNAVRQIQTGKTEFPADLSMTPGKAPMPESLPSEEAPADVNSDQADDSADIDHVEDAPESSVSESEPGPVAADESANENSWSSLDELSGQQSARPSSRAWRVNEFRPRDREAISGAVKNGVRTRMPKFPKPASNRSSLYLFGVVRTDDAMAEDFEGIDGITEGTSVRLLSCGTLTALVSATTDAMLHPEAIKESMTDSAWLKTHVRRHADVLAEAQSIQTVIPLRFGCVLPNPSEIKKFVDARQDTLMDALSRLHNRSEFSVRVRFENESPAGADDDLKGVPSGVAEFLRQAAADVEHAPSPDGIADRIHSHLSRFAGEAMRSPVEGTDMILNATYLIVMASEEDFRTEVRKLSSEFHALGIRIEVSGPWPPYHFVDIDFGGGMEGEEVGSGI